MVLNLFLLLAFTACRQEENGQQPVDPEPTQQLEQFAMQHTEAGVLKWTLVGEVLTIIGEESDVSRDKVTVQNPKVQIFEEGQVAITLTSKRGQHFLRGKEKDNLHLREDVVGISENGTLYTEELFWQNKKGTLYAPNEVKIVRGNSTWYGTEMVANPTLETVNMENNRFTLYSKDEEIHD